MKEVSAQSNAQRALRKAKSATTRICILRFSDGRKLEFRDGDVPSANAIALFYKKRAEKRAACAAKIPEMKRRLAALRGARSARAH
ncbi:hypothetical protein [Bradyrhizobium sp. CIR3A]|uniref:hypothetical protein n=1 Tax=Bradyrhizobium sp. CIR3A TaxID=2663838 RepID=UPI001606EB43|nr:hypothetical protein [Bradyrhizobium sp. CIR3A]MBB4257295.1 hypothetical protein [Bradyrhizobium sp. CIR3A]